MSRRWCRCSAPSSRSTELGPSIGRRISFASPAWTRSGGAVKTSRIAAGAASITQGRSSMRTGDVSPKRAWHCWADQRGRASHADICRARGARGPGGRAASMNASVHCTPDAGPAFRDRRRDPRRQRPLPRRRRRRLRREVGHRLRRGRPGAGARQAAQGTRRERPAADVRPQPRDRRRHRLLLAEPPQAGVVGEAICTDISPGMLRALEDNARTLHLSVETRACDAEDLPFADGEFDLVLGHAVLHHLPDLARAFGEFRRVLRPGGTVLFAGEPSRYGDRLASVPKRAAAAVAPLWRTLMRAGPARNGHADGGAANHELEAYVDVHAFTPDTLERAARHAGFADVRVRGEELLANWFGWANRALEATADPDDVPWAWKVYAFRGYLALQKVDSALLEPRLPPAIFYNLMLSARTPAGPTSSG